MSSVIKRIVHGHACNWCMNLAGTYAYPDDVPSDVYRRHDNCRCTVTYDPRDGSRRVQDVHTKESMSYDKTKTIGISNLFNLQNYKSVERVTKATTMKDYVGRVFNTHKVKAYKNVYIEDRTHIKRRALQSIVKTTNNAIKDFDIDESGLRIVILNEKSINYALGRYDAVNNVVYYNSQIKIKGYTGGANGLTEYHEMWHMKQAQIYKSKGKTINNESDYLEYIKTCVKKKDIDKLGITQYNLSLRVEKKIWC